jgi:hypothetical protein
VLVVPPWFRDRFIVPLALEVVEPEASVSLLLNRKYCQVNITDI